MHLFLLRHIAACIVYLFKICPRGFNPAKRSGAGDFGAVNVDFE